MHVCTCLRQGQASHHTTRSLMSLSSVLVGPLGARHLFAGSNQTTYHFTAVIPQRRQLLSTVQFPCRKVRDVAGIGRWRKQDVSMPVTEACCRRSILTFVKKLRLVHREGEAGPQLNLVRVQRHLRYEARRPSKSPPTIRIRM